MLKKIRYVADTSAIISGDITEMVKKGTLRGELIIPEFVMSELENQANRGKDSGFEGLGHLKELQEFAKQRKIIILSLGRKPTTEEIQLASSGRIDALIRDIAKHQNAILLTADMVQAKVAEAENVQVVHFAKEPLLKLKIEEYFDPTTMSVHLKEGTTPKAKRGKPGRWRLVEVYPSILTRDRLEKKAKEIMDTVRTSEDSIVEIGKYGATVVQLKNYRIAITRPPFSKRMEITAVRPIVKVNLDDYKLSERLKKRLEERAEGILIAGPPGSGKSTLASAIAEFYQKKQKIVKTLENPRDLQVNQEITQYSPLEGDMAKSADILLLVRPDFTIYDELRKTKDFTIFSDMRFSGIGMVGVVHASEAIEAVQRFMGRVELGLIPQVVNTVIFVKDGEIKAVYALNLEVKVPTGMTEDDLARPVVLVKDFETDELRYEIYMFGEQAVVVPIKKPGATSSVDKMAEEKVRDMIRRYVKNAEVKIISPNRAVVRVPEEDVSYLIGKQGKRITELEKKIGIHLTVEPIIETLKKELNYDLEELGGYISIILPKKEVGNQVDVYKGEEFLFSATIGRKARIKINKRSELGKKILQAFALKNLRILI